MSEGDLRRAPLLWEQRLQALIPNVGVQGVADAEVLGDSPPGPGAGDEEPSEPPVLDEDPSTPRVPSAPVVASVTLGLVISWDGRDFDGDVMPVGSYVDVHVDTVSGFTPDSSNLVGRIVGEGSFTYTAGTAGTTYYVKFVGFGPDGGQIGESAQASASPGLIQGPEINGDAVITQILSDTTPATTFALGSIWLNTSNGSYNVLEDVGGTPTWVTRPWDTAGIKSNAITANQIAAQAILTKFLTGEVIRTGATDSARVQISAAGGIEVFRDATTKTFWAKPTGEVVFGSASVSTAGTTVINGDAITTGTVSGDRISGGTIVGSTIVTRGDGFRVRLKDGGAGGTDHMEFLSGSNVRGRIYATDLLLGIQAPGDVALYNISGSPVFANLQANNIGAAGSSDLVGRVFATDAYINPQSGIDTLGINTNYALRRLSSSQDIKYDISEVSGSLSPLVDAARLSDVVTVDPRDLLNVAVVEFSAIDDGEPTERRLVGFIAEDMAEKFPVGATRKPDGSASGIETQSVVASLLAIVRDQQGQIDALTARLDSLQ